MVLRRLPFRIMSGIGGEDDKRLTAEVGQRGCLLHRLGPSRNSSIWLQSGARSRSWRALVPRTRRQTVVGGLGEQASGSEVGDRGQWRGDATRKLSDWVLVGWSGPDLGAVESSNTMPAT